MATKVYNIELDWYKIEKISVRIVLLALTYNCSGLGIA